MNVPNSTYFDKSLCLLLNFESWEAGVPEMERSRCAWSIFFDRIKKYSLEVSASTKTWRKTVLSYCETVCDCVADCVRITRNFTFSACFSWGGDFLWIFLNSVKKMHQAHRDLSISGTPASQLSKSQKRHSDNVRKCELGTFIECTSHIETYQGLHFRRIPQDCHSIR